MKEFACGTSEESWEDFLIQQDGRFLASVEKFKKWELSFDEMQLVVRDIRRAIRPGECWTLEKLGFRSLHEIHELTPATPSALTRRRKKLGLIQE